MSAAGLVVGRPEGRIFTALGRRSVVVSLVLAACTAMAFVANMTQGDYPLAFGDVLARIDSLETSA